MNKKEKHKSLIQAGELIMNVVNESEGSKRQMLNVALMALLYAAGIMPTNQVEDLLNDPN